MILHQLSQQFFGVVMTIDSVVHFFKTAVPVDMANMFFDDW